MAASNTPRPLPLRDRRVVLGVTGSIAAYKAFDLARRLEEAGATVDVALTSNAARFAPVFTFKNLVHGVVADSMWTSDTPELHVELGRGADAYVIAPATATTLAKLAYGIGDSLVTLTALTTTAPLLVAPAMDAQMYAHPAVQANVETLRTRGVEIVGPVMGRLASGHEGLGRLADPLEITGAVRAAIGRRVGDLQKRHVVITAGGTREAIDPVRYVGNRSSGKMGFALAEAARDRGAAVTLITTQPPPAGLTGVAVELVESAAAMLAALQRATATSDALIMAAAVADYRPREASAQKLKKRDRDALSLDLEENPDLLASLQGGFVRVGFAAETQDVLVNAQEKLAEKRLDLIVANDVTAEGSGFGTETNCVTLIGREGTPESLPLLHKYDVALRVLDRIAALLPR